MKQITKLKDDLKIISDMDCSSHDKILRMFSVVNIAKNKVEAFRNEDRYTVLKNEDLNRCLNGFQYNQLTNILKTTKDFRAKMGKPTLEFLVIEKDWPEYDPAMLSIEDRVLNDE